MKLPVFIQTNALSLLLALFGLLSPLGLALTAYSSATHRQDLLNVSIVLTNLIITSLYGCFYIRHY